MLSLTITLTETWRFISYEKYLGIELSIRKLETDWAKNVSLVPLIAYAKVHADLF